MRLLIDTHIAIWSVADSTRLPPHIREIIATPENMVFVSTVSLFEIAIKSRLNRRSAPPFSAKFAHDAFLAVGYLFLAVTAEHALTVESLQLDHEDPFDRLILAQALSEPLILVTKDRQLAAHGDTIISW